MNDDLEDYYDDGWLWLPPSEVAKLQAQKNILLRAALDKLLDKPLPDGDEEIA